MPFKPAPRLASALYIGVQRYFLTICTNRRTRMFVDAAAVELVTSTLRRASDDLAFSVLA